MYPGAPNHKCECYLKLDELGIPFYGSEDEETKSEHREEIPYDTAYVSLGPLKINDKLKEYPVVKSDELYIIFQQMTKVIPSLADFEINLLSFWMMDMFIEGLSTAQKANFPHEHQKATLEWIAYFFNYIKSNNPTRVELFSHLKMLLFVPERVKSYDFYGEGYVGEYVETDDDLDAEWSSMEGDKKDWELPLPPGASKPMVKTNSEPSLTNESKSEGSKKTQKTFQSSSSESDQSRSPSRRNLANTIVLLEILYRIFGRLWVFLEIQTAFCFTPNVTQIELPFKLNFPKPLCKQTEILYKTGRGVSSSQESEVLLHKSDFICPLNTSEDAKFFLKNNISDRLPLDKGKGKK